MGRTLPTPTMLVEQERARWRKFRRALRKEDQALLDDLLSDARRHGQAQAYASWATPYEAILVSILLEQAKRIKKMEGALDALTVHPPLDGGSSVKVRERFGRSGPPVLKNCRPDPVLE